MKNIHILPTDKPSRLLKTIPKGNLILSKSITSGSHWENQHIYITSEEEIKEGDWYLRTDTNALFNTLKGSNINIIKKYCKKVILTTDQDLDGVQAIDDDFLEWFVKNPSCEEVEVNKICNNCGDINCIHSICKSQIAKTKGVPYKIIIPKEEHPKQIKCYCGHTTYCDCSPLEESKQKTLEEAAESRFGTDMDSIRGSAVYDLNTDLKRGFIEGAKWQQERSYSEEDLRNAYRWGTTVNHGTKEHFKEWLKQFKKK